MTEVYVGDKVRATKADGTEVVGLVTYSSGIDVDYLEVSDFAIDLTEGWSIEVLSSRARVGDLYVKGLPVGSVVAGKDGTPIMRTISGWIDKSDYRFKNPDGSLDDTTIVYLP